MISRGDMYEKIPPMPDKMPPTVLENLELDPNVAHQALMNLVSQNVGEVFQSPVEKQAIVALKDTSTISDAIKEFITPHIILNSQGVKKTTYFTALPVLNSKKEIEGIVSFVDIFKKFFKHQTKFMDTPLFHLATMAEYYQEPEEHDKKIKVRKAVLTKLGVKSTFSNAKMIMDIRGFRSLPVVIEEPVVDAEGKPLIDEEGKPVIKVQEIIGFVNDVQIKMFSHKDFLRVLFPLPVSYFMTKVDLLHKPKPDDVIDQLIDMFSLPDGNQQIPSSFAICDSDERNRLLGIVSYLDILKYWKDR
jgi:CBS domain-containing protein